MQKPAHQIYSFDEFTLDLTRSCLLRQTEEIKLRPKSFEVLKFLVENNGRLVSKDEIIAAVWTDTAVTDDSLVQCLKDIRRALNDKSQIFIKTIPRRGYIFEKEVSENDTTIYTEETARINLVIEEKIDGRGDKKLLVVPVLIVASLVAVAAVGFFLSGFLRLPKSAPVFRQLNSTRLTNTGKAWDASISPDGNLVAYVAEENGRQSVRLRQVKTAETTQIVAPVENTGFAKTVFSKDGQFVYFLSSPDNAEYSILNRVSILGGRTEKVLDGVESRVSFSPDGGQMVFVREIAAEDSAILMVAKTNGSEVRELKRRKQPEIFGLGSPDWSADGQKIIFAAGIDNWNTEMKLFEIPLAGGAETQISPQVWRSVGDIVQTNDGLRLMASTPQGEPFQIWKLDYPSGTTELITPDNYYVSLSLSADGSRYCLTQAQISANVWLVSAENREPSKQLTDGSREGLWGLAWTRDGQILFDSRANAPQQHIWSMNFDGTNPQPLTINSAANDGQTVSPDGRFIVFCSRRNAEDTINLWRMDADGGNVKKLTNGTGEYFPVFTPDSSAIIYDAAEKNVKHRTIWKISIEGGQPERLIDKPATNPAVSPDGKFLAYYVLENDFTGIECVTLPEKYLVRRFELPLNRNGFRFSPDGHALVYVKWENGVDNLWQQPLDGGAPQKVTDFSSGQIYNFAFSPDGKHIALSHGSFKSEIVLIENFK